MFRFEGESGEGKMKGVNHGFDQNHRANVFLSGTVPFSPGSFSGQFDAMGNCLVSSSSSESFMTAPFDGFMHQNMTNSAGRSMGSGLFNHPSEERSLNVPYDVGLCEDFLKMHVGDQQRDYCNTSKIRFGPDGFLGRFNDPLSDSVSSLGGIEYRNQPVHDYSMGWGQRWDVPDAMGPSSFLTKRDQNALYSEDRVDYLMKPVKEQGRGYWSQGVQQQRPLMVNDRPCLSNGLYNYSNTQQCGIIENAGMHSSQLADPLLELDLGYKLQMLKQKAGAIPNHGINLSGPALPLTNTGPIEAFNFEGSFILDATGQCPKCSAEKKSKRSKVHKKNSRNDDSMMIKSSEKDLVLDCYQGACGSGSWHGQSKLKEIPAKGSSLGITTPLPTQLTYRSLADLQGYIYSMCKHQLGCRFLQKIFDEGSDQDIEIIFREVIDNVVDLMVDPFGNYLIQKLLDACTEEQRTMVVLMVTKKRGELVSICLDSHGTRVVQKLIETIKSKQHILMIILALKPGLLQLINDLNGNHVVQKCLQCLGNEHNKFIYDTAAKFCVDIATHQNGCCVLNRCIAYSSGKNREKLVSSICANGLLLARDAFGNYVIQYIIELKIPSAAATLLSQFEGHFAYLSMQKFSSHVIEKCLRFIEESHSRIIQELISVPQFDQLLQDRYANYVIQSALEVTKGSTRGVLVEAIRPYEVLRTSPYCKKIFSRNLLKK